MAVIERDLIAGPRRLARYAGSVCAYAWRWQRHRMGAWLVTAFVFGVVLSVAAVAHLLVWLGGASLTAQLHSASEMQVFLSDTATPEQAASLKAKLAAVPGVHGVTLRTKAQAAAVAAHDDQLSSLAAESDGNPFPASYVLQMTDPQVGRRVLAQVSNDPAVDSKVPASYTATQAQQVSSALAAMRIGAWALDAAALGVGVVVALALLRAELRARREELRVLALVGVPRTVMRLPLVIQALSLALAGSLMAVASLLWVGRTVVPAMNASVPLLRLGDPTYAISSLCLGVAAASAATLIACALLVRLPR